MLNINVLIILLIKLHLAICFEANDFCVLKQQECKGFIDDQQKYQIKCNLIKCHGIYSNDCHESHICSNNTTNCKKYNKIKLYFKKRVLQQNINRYLAAKNNFISFNKNIKNCKNKVYEFDQNDYCVNRRKCQIALGHRYKMTKEIECRCPTENQSFKCGKICASDSNACDYYQAINKNNNEQFENIKDCNIYNITYFRPYFNLFNG